MNLCIWDFERALASFPKAYLAIVGNVLGNRAALGSTIDSVLYDSADSYSQTKLAYLQGRRFRLNPEISEVYSDPYDEMDD